MPFFVLRFVVGGDDGDSLDSAETEPETKKAREVLEDEVVISGKCCERSALVAVVFVFSVALLGVVIGLDICLTRNETTCK